MDVNWWFDRLPRTTLDIGARRVPAFRSLGILGFHVAFLTAVLAGLVNGTPLVTTLGLSTTAGLSFFGWAFVRRAATGGEKLVLIEYVWVAMASVAAFLWLAGGPVVGPLDVFSVAVCPFLAFGRLGCLTVGCCHGVPAPTGIRYGPGHHLPPRLENRRLLPVPLFEAVALVVIGAVGFGLLAGGGEAGTATVWALTAYAVVRFGLERLRGDRRPTVGVVSVAQASCVVQAVLALVLAEAWLVPGPPGRATWVGLALLALALAAGVGLVRSRPGRSLVTPAHLDETWELVVDLAGRAPAGQAGEAGGPATGRTGAGLVVAVSDRGTGWAHVSLSHPEASALGVGLALGSGASEANGITHVAVPFGPDADEAQPHGQPARPGPGRATYFESPERRGAA